MCETTRMDARTKAMNRAQQLGLTPKVNQLIKLKRDKDDADRAHQVFCDRFDAALLELGSREDQIGLSFQSLGDVLGVPRATLARRVKQYQKRQANQ